VALERLQKILSRAGIASRRAAEKVLAEGRISVNGEKVAELGSKADPERDDIRVDGVRLRPPKAPVHLLLYKPKGVVCTRHDPEGRETVMDLVPKVAGLFPVGRLDSSSEGLILLTNDGAFSERVSHPRYEVPKAYHVKVRGQPEPATLSRLTRGVVVEGERLVADRVRLIEAALNSWVEVVVHEGKRHEVRRLLAAVGHPVSKLRRVSIGSVTLRGLKPGEYRSLTPAEIASLARGGSGSRAPRNSSGRAARAGAPEGRPRSPRRRRR
jgi:23S rRNA pseudouridine2605 synthase